MSRPAISLAQSALVFFVLGQFILVQFQLGRGLGHSAYGFVPLAAPVLHAGGGLAVAAANTLAARIEGKPADGQAWELWWKVTLAWAPFIMLCGVVPVATGVLAAGDARDLELEKYKAGVMSSPGKVFVGVALLWVISFPAYLLLRTRLVSGRLQLREKYRTEFALRAAIREVTLRDGAPGGSEGWRGTPEGRIERWPWVMLALAILLSLLFIVVPRLIGR
jgi:hypothetical protein